MINEAIRNPEVRLVGDNVENGVYPTSKALEMARELGLDLVVISDKSVPFICKITEYSKFLYERKKKQKELKSKSAKTVVKEIRFGPNTDEHDFEFKTKHAEKFLDEGAKVKAFVHFKGRAIVYKERGEILLLRFAEALQEHGKVESMPKLEGKRMIMFLTPAKSPKKA
ncbi:MAG: translation initiation factor IF-3 [Bacteroidetes bacterium]|jgi:translation initiation factor IF-3|nr:translation initiation factor IF-3 [Bacteroidota bacterium]